MFVKFNTVGTKPLHREAFGVLTPKVSLDLCCIAWL